MLKKKKRKSEVGKEMENANMFSSKKGEAKIKKKRRRNWRTEKLFVAGLCFKHQQ